MVDSVDSVDSGSDSVDSDSVGHDWPSCCYWRGIWEVVCIILLFTYLFFFVFNFYCLWRLAQRAGEGRFRCKKFFHRSSISLTSVRMLQMIFLILGDSVWPHQTYLYYIAQLITYMGANLFVLVYGAMVAYWATFYLQTKYGDYFSTTKYNERLQIAILGTEIFFLSIILLESALLCYMKLVQNKALLVVIPFLFFTSIILLLEGIAFAVVGILLYLTLQDPGNPINFNHAFSNKSFQIVVIALILFLVMFLRAIFLIGESIAAMNSNLGEIYSERPYDVNDSDHMFMGEDLTWWFYLLYYLLGECFPLGLMTFFQSRLPKSKKSTYELGGPFRSTINFEEEETLQLRPAPESESDYD